MKKIFFLKFNVVLLLFFVSALIPVFAIGFNDEAEFNDFLGIVGVPDGYELDCECGKIDGGVCYHKVTDKYCLYRNAATNEQFIVGLECARNKFNLPDDVYIPDKNGINANYSFSYGSKIQNACDFGAVKAFKYFFNRERWGVEIDDGFVSYSINLKGLYKDLGINCEEEDLKIAENIFRPCFKVIYMENGYYTPTFSCNENAKNSEKFLWEIYIAYEQFCRKHKINNIYGYNNIRFDNDLIGR